jgi:hypothetical protein
MTIVLNEWNQVLSMDYRGEFHAQVNGGYQRHGLDFFKDPANVCLIGARASDVGNVACPANVVGISLEWLASECTPFEMGVSELKECIVGAQLVAFLQSSLQPHLDVLRFFR